MAWTVIDHEELTGAAASWTSTTIPSSYDHLCLWASVKTDQSGQIYSAQLVQFNGDDAAHYASTNIYAWSTSNFSVDHADVGEYDGFSFPQVAGPVSASETFGTMMVWVPDYANTVNHKAVFIHSTAPYGASLDGQTKLTGGRWEDTSAVTSITVIPGFSGDLQQYSTFTLYGLTGA